jgi:hypothetical protein
MLVVVVESLWKLVVVVESPFQLVIWEVRSECLYRALVLVVDS